MVILISTIYMIRSPSNKVKRLIFQVIAGCLSEEEIMGLKEMFKSIDTDNSGTITLEELKQGLAKQGTKLSEYEAKQLMEAVSDTSIDQTLSLSISRSPSRSTQTHSRSRSYTLCVCVYIYTNY